MKETTYSKSIANAINKFLTDNDLNFSFDEQLGQFILSSGIKSKLKKLNYIINVEDYAFIVYAISPIGVDADDENSMTEMAEFVCRANYGLRRGNFELDMRDGEIRYKCHVDCKGIIPTNEMVANNIITPIAMFDRYGDGIVDIIFGNVPAKEAVERCEQ